MGELLRCSLVTWRPEIDRDARIVHWDAASRYFSIIIVLLSSTSYSANPFFFLAFLWHYVPGSLLLAIYILFLVSFSGNTACYCKNVLKPFLKRTYSRAKQLFAQQDSFCKTLFCFFHRFVRPVHVDLKPN